MIELEKEANNSDANNGWISNAVSARRIMVKTLCGILNLNNSVLVLPWI